MSKVCTPPFFRTHRTCDPTAGGGGYERTAPSHHQHGDAEMPACLPHPQRHATGCLAVFASVTNLPQRNRLNLITADAHCRSCSSMGSTTQPATSNTATPYDDRCCCGTRHISGNSEEPGCQCLKAQQRIAPWQPGRCNRRGKEARMPHSAAQQLVS